MRPRYQVKDPDGTIVYYETESLPDAKRAWKAHIGSGVVLVDVLHNAGLVVAPGDNTMLRQTAERILDQFFAELPACCEYFEKDHRRKDAMMAEVSELKTPQGIV